MDIDEAVQKSSKKFEAKCEELLESRRVESNIIGALNTLSACVPVFITYSKLQKQIVEKR